MVRGHISRENKEFVGKLLIMVVVFLLFKGGALIYRTGMENFLLVDTDCYMRLVRVQQLADTGAWFDNTIYRSNVPFGEILHWSRPLDVLLLLGAYIGSIFLPFREALFWWGYIISPIFMIVSVLALNWAARPIFDKEKRIFVVLFFLCQTVAMAYYSFGRPDHHSLLLLLFILQIGSVLHMISKNEKKSIYPYFSGLVAALGMWVSIETLATIFLVSGTLIILWLAKSQHYFRSLQQFILTVTFCSFVFLLLERPIWQLTVVEYDKISIVHVVSFVVIWLVLRFGTKCFDNKKRTTFFYVLLLVVMTSCGLSVLFPGLLKSPYMEIVDPRAISLWLSKVQEAQPISFGDQYSAAISILSLGSIMWVLPYSLSPLIGERKITAEWFFFNFGLLLFFLFTCHQIRFAPYLELMILCPMTYVLSMMFDRIKKMQRQLLRSVARIFVIIFLAIIPQAVVLAIVKEPVVSFSPPIHDLSVFLNHYENPKTLLAWIDFGPQLLYETKHNVISTPYHRNSSGILYWYDVMTAENDEQAHELLQGRFVNYIVICPKGSEITMLEDIKDKNTFYNRLVNGQCPVWLQRIPLDENLKNSFLLLKVIGGVN